MKTSDFKVGDIVRSKEKGGSMGKILQIKYNYSKHGHLAIVNGSQRPTGWFFDDLLLVKPA